MRVGLWLATMTTLCLVMLACFAGQVEAQQASSVAAGPASTGFIENRGQIEGPVLYYAPGAEMTMFFTSGAVVFEVSDESAGAVREGRDHLTDLPGQISGRRASVWLQFDGANPSPAVEARGVLPTQYNFFLGNDPERWQTGVRAYSEIIYRDVWPGIDLVYREQGGRVTYDVVAAPGADLARVNFRYEGAERVAARVDGASLVETEAGSFVHLPPRPDGTPGAFALGEHIDHLVGDHRREGVMEWSTLLGGSHWCDGYAIDVDEAGSSYVTGFTKSIDFPTTPGGDFPLHNGGWDAFVSKLSPDGSTLLYSTFLGGTDNDYGRSIVLDGEGCVYVAGTTMSPDFPVTPDVVGPVFNGGEYDAFVVKLDPVGERGLEYSTYLGGGGWDLGRGVDVDLFGFTYVTGWTNSVDFPVTLDAEDDTHNGGYDVFVTKLSPDAEFLMYGSYIGGAADDYSAGIVLSINLQKQLVDVFFIAGTTESPDFPVTAGAEDDTHNGEEDVFVLRMDIVTEEKQGALTYSTFWGGSAPDFARGLAVDFADNVFVTGWTESPDFPTTLASFDETRNGYYCDAFVFRLDPELGELGRNMRFSTLLGGTGQDYGRAIAVDGLGRSYVTGYTNSTDFPITGDGFQTILPGTYDAFVTKFSGSGDIVDYSTYLGGLDHDHGAGITVNIAGNAYVTGYAESWDFPTTPGAYDETFNGVGDVYVTKFDGLARTDVAADGGISRATMLGGNWPNPFSPTTTIQFALDRGGETLLQVFDVKGRLVRTLVEGSIAGGPHAVSWDGRDARGSAVAPGLYFYRLRTGMFDESRKMILLR